MGIRGKLVISIVALAFFIGAAPVAYSIHQHRQTIYQEFETRGSLTAEHLAHNLAQWAAKLESIDHPRSLSNVLNEPDILRVFALDATGDILSDGTSTLYREGKRLVQFDAVEKRARASDGVVATKSVGTVQFTAPVRSGDRTLGFVHVVMSMRRADAMIERTMLTEGLMLGALVMLGVLLAFIMSYTFSTPVVWMLKGTEAIKKGNYNVRIPVKTHDEFGKLAASINGLADSLRSTTVSKNYVHEILQSMVDTLIVVDTEATIVTVNRATLDLLGYEESQLVGQPASLICIDEGYQLTGTRLQHLLGTESQEDHELLYRSRDGRQIPISFGGSTIRDHTDTVVGYVCLGKNITERKLADVEREQLNAQLVKTSRQAGMAEVATGVLHNVGNVLNSVNMSASMVLQTVKQSKVSGLSKAVELLDGHADDPARFIAEDERGRKLPHYLSEVAKHLSTEQDSIRQELDSLTKNISHIKDIIATQQSYSKTTGVLESVELAELLDEALRLNITSLERHHIKVVRRVSYVPPTKTDKHQVLQILVNFITNAKDAMEDNEGEKILTISLAQDMDDPATVRLSVADNGVGIADDNRTRIFTHGFTTKRTGHGFGLHSAALTAKELDGELLVHSEGPGTGATFTLTLPLEVAGVTR